MKICFILEHYFPHIGGAETICRGMATHLKSMGHSVRVITSTSGGISGKTIDKGVEVFHYNWPSFFGHPVPIASTIEEHVSWSDIVHTATYTAAPIASFSAQKYQKPCVITAYEVLGQRWKDIESNPLKSFAFKSFEQFVISRHYSAYHAISHATERDIVAAGIAHNKVMTIYPGVEMGNAVQTSHNHAISNDKNIFTLCYFGRPGKTKGLSDLIQAFRILQNRNQLKNIQLIAVVSNDPYSEKINTMNNIKEWGLQAEVQIRDPLPQAELIKTIKQSDCVVVPSRTEGFGFSAVEACTLGKPVIISDAGSLPEVVFGKVLQFNAGNSDNLAATILLAKEGSFSTIATKKYSWKDSVNQLESLYKSLL